MITTTTPASCQDPGWVVGRLVYAFSILMLFSSMSIHLGSKECRDNMPKPIKRGLFILAQCSVVAVTSLDEVSPALAAFLAGAFTQQFGTEPYWNMGLLALQKLLCHKSSSSSKQRPVVTKSSSFPFNDGLKILLLVGVAIHHYCIIVAPLFIPCLSSVGYDTLSLFLGAIVILGCIAGLSPSNLVRAGTDVVAIGLYWTWLVWNSTSLGPIRTILTTWVILASLGDLLIGLQLLLWQILVPNKEALTTRNNVVDIKVVDVDTAAAVSEVNLEYGEECEEDLEDPFKNTSG